MMVAALAFSPLQRIRVENEEPLASSSSTSTSSPPQSSSHQERMLCLGIGGGELISFLQHNHPYLSIDAIDIDTNIVDLARRWFGYRDDDDDTDHRLDENDNDERGDVGDDGNDNDGNDHQSDETKHPTNRPHTMLTDAWAFLHTLATNISRDSSTSATTTTTTSSSSSSSELSTSPSSTSSSSLYYDYVMVDLFTAECTRPDNNDTNVHGNK